MAAFQREHRAVQEGIPCTVDFETEGIGPRPNEYPPRPVGVAIRYPTGATRYMAWGHPSGNNCTLEEARAELWQCWQLYPILCHNAAFDFEVAHKWLGFNMPRRWHDTLFILFLCFPHRSTYSLKPTSEDLLGELPAERDALREWIIANVPEARPSTWGAFICRAPTDIVAPYAIGDTTRTFGLWERYWPFVSENMLTAYERERVLMPALVKASKRGIRADRPKLSIWNAQLYEAVSESDERIYDVLGKAINVDANDEVADAIESAGLLRDEGWPLTPTGRRSTSKGSLVIAVKHQELVRLLAYRNTAATLQRTFVDRWITDSATDGRLHCAWHQTRSDEGGTRTGRIASSQPNLANVPNPQDKVVVPDGLPRLPNLRDALLPEEGHLWLSADFRSQELRMLAHFEGGDLADTFSRNPDLDLHDHARLMIEKLTGHSIDRKGAKTIGFAILYGAGNRKLGEQLGVSLDAAAGLRRAYLSVMPGVARVQAAATERWAKMQPIRTFGGRVVPAQPPSMVNGRRVSWEYKALNMLIQGSSADQTKEALIRLDRNSTGLGMLLLSQLYDEINVSVPTDNLLEGAAALNEAMTKIPGLDVPFLIDLEAGPSWGSMSPLTLARKP